VSQYLANQRTVSVRRAQRAELKRLVGELEGRLEPMTAIEREQLARTAWGAFADVPTSSVEFKRRKHRDHDEEEARRGDAP
jgi:hypothetical protein